MRPLGLLLVALAGCASGGATEEEMSRLRRELYAVKAELAGTKQDLEKVQTQLSLINVGNKSPPPSSEKTSAPPPREGMKDLPVVRLGNEAPRARPSKHADDENGAVDDGGPPVLIRVGPGEGDEKLPVDREVLKKPDPVLSKKGLPDRKSMRAEYQLGVDTLRDKNQPAQARALLVAFRQRYPDSELSVNAAYWIAECSFAEQQHQRAIDEFNQLIEAHPMSAKVPDALLRVGQSFTKLGQANQAKSIFERVLRGYPGSEAAGVADKALRALAATPEGR